MSKLVEVAELFEKIRNTSGKKAKQSILRSVTGSDLEDLTKEVLLYTYDINKVYGAGKKVVDEIMSDKVKSGLTANFNGNIFNFLDYLSKTNMSDDVKSEIKYVIDSLGDISVVDMFCKILLKDMRIGMAEKSINEVFEGLIWTMDIMLANSLEKRLDKVKGQKFIVTPKLDGIRVVVVNEPNNVKLITRQGKLIEGCYELEEEIKKLPHNVYDGELLAENPDGLDAIELFQKTRKITGSKGKKTGLEFHVFDMISLYDFENKVNKDIASARKTFAKEAICTADVNLVKCVPIYLITDDMNEIKTLLDKVVKEGQEGLMLNTIDGFYDFRRSNNLLKAKKFYSIDVKIVGFEEGTGKNADRLGALLVDYKGNTVGVGSGFSDKDRDDIWLSRHDLKGKVVEINYFEETKNEQGGISLRFPTFVRLRLDKDEVSYE